MKIGEILVRGGHLSREQLAQALRVQELVGGRLGTALVAERLVAEDVLLEALGRQRSTRTVPSAELADVPPEVVRMIPARLAGRYGIVPFHLKGRTLSVASKDVSDLLKEDEVSFLTSCMVKTCIALEFRIDEGLERYYRIRAPDRHRALARRLACGPADAPSAVLQPQGPASPRPAPAPTPAPTLAASPSPAPMPVPTPVPSPSPVRSRPAPAPVAAAAPAPQAAPPPPSAQPRFIELDEEDAALLGASRSDSSAWAPESDEPVLLEPTPLPWLSRDAVGGEAAPFDHRETLDVAVAAAPAEPVEETVDESDLEERLRRAAVGLRDVEIRDDIGDVLLAFCAPFFRRRVILVTRKEHIVGWRGEGEGIESDRVRAVDVGAHDPSVFLGLTSAGSFWLGALPPLDANRALVDGLGGEFPRDCVVLPVILRSRVVCYLYGDNLDAGVAGAPIAELRRLVAKAGIAFEVYILKNKLRML